jgi:peptide/nickel transport system substrate-binding protein
MLTSPDRRRSRFSVVFVLLRGTVLFAPFPALAQSGKPAPGEMRWALHVTLAARWLDPAETEAFSTPFMVMYAVHDAMLKPMPAGLITPSLAES